LPRTAGFALPPEEPPSIAEEASPDLAETSANGAEDRSRTRRTRKGMNLEVRRIEPALWARCSPVIVVDTSENWRLSYLNSVIDFPPDIIKG